MQALGCSSTTAGAIRYNSSVPTIEFCNGSTWTQIPQAATTCGSPSGLSFTNLTNQPLSTVVASTGATITFTGCTGSYVASVSGVATGQISINGGAWTTSGAIASGQTLQVRMTTSNNTSTLLTATVTVGSSSTNWTTTTRSGALKVFATANGYNGNLGGLTGADAICQSEANTAGYAGTYKAILSSSTVSAASRLTVSYPIANAYNGSTVAAANLWVGSISTPILRPSGNNPGNAWTGSYSDGTIAGANSSSYQCVDWTSSSTSKNAEHGYADSTTQWLDYDNSNNCHTQFVLLCLQQ